MKQRDSCLRFGSLIVAVSFASGCSTYPISNKLQADLIAPAPGVAARFAGDIESALDAANDQRTLYWQAVSDNAKARQFAGVALIALSAAAVYKGINSDSDSTKRWLAKAGALGGAAYLGSDYLTNVKAETAYLDAYKEITCSILWTRPLLVAASDYETWLEEVNRLELKIASVDLSLSRVQALRAFELEQPRGRELNKGVGREFRNTINALKAARKLLERSRSLKTRIETAGFALRRRVEDIGAGVGKLAHDTEPPIPNPSNWVTRASSISKSFTDIKPVSQADPADEADTPAVESGSDGNADKVAGGGGAAATSGKAEAGGSAEAECASAEAPMRATANGKDKDPKSAARIAKLEADNKKLKAKLEAKTPSPVEKISEKERKELRLEVSRMYAQHRKVNALLVGVNDIKESVKAIDPCRGTDHPLILTPDVNEVTAVPGQTYQFGISGGRGIPKAWLVGSTGGEDKKSIKLATVIENGAVVAKVTIGACAPPGAAQLVVTDADGAQREEVAIKINGRSASSSGTGAK